MKKIMKRLIALLCVVTMIGVMIPADLLPVKAQESQEESRVKKVLTSCDSKDEASNIAVSVVVNNTTYYSGGTQDTTYVQEGTASLKSSTATTTATIYNLFLASPVDVQGYQYFHCKLWISDPDMLQSEHTGVNSTIGIKLSPDYVDTTNAVTFAISNKTLVEGWNDITIPFTDAISTGTGYTGQIKFVQIIQRGSTRVAGVTTYLDDVCVLKDEICVETVTEGEINPAPAEAPTKEGYVFGGYYRSYNENTKKFSQPLEEVYTATAGAPIYVKWVTEEVMTVKAQIRQDDYDDCKKVLTSCDSKDEASNIAATGSTGELCTGHISEDLAYVKEGTGSLKATTNITKESGTNTLYNIYLSNPVDVRGYKYFSCKLHLSSLDQIKSSGSTLGIVLSPTHGESNNQSLQFQVSQAEFQGAAIGDGWYEFKLPFAQAEVIRNDHDTDNDTIKMGTYSGAAINYIRIFQYGASGLTGELTTYLDDVCVLNENPGILIADCDQMKAPNSAGMNLEDDYAYVNGQVSYVNGDLTKTVNTSSIDTDNKMEGTGALKALCYQNGQNSASWRMLTQIRLSDANKLDLSSYKDTGYLHLWLYLSDLDSINANGVINIELTSYGNADYCEANWTVSKTALKEGWNEIVKPLKTHGTDKADYGEINWKSVNYIRVFTVNATEAAFTSGQYMLVDDVRIVDSIQVANCDSQDEVTAPNLEGTTAQTTDKKQGTGAFIHENYTSTTQHKLRFANGVDFSAFKGSKGSLRFWYYIEDPARLGDDLIVELSSNSSNTSVQAGNQRYIIKKNDLVAGWNEIYVYLDDTVNAVTTGTVDWTSIKHICILTETAFTSACTTKLDDISLVPGNKETIDVRFVSTVESLGYRLVGYEITQSRSTTPLKTETTNVYKVLYTLGTNGVRDSVTPKGISGVDCSTYIHAATVVNIPNRLWDATFTVTPYWETQDGTEQGTIVKGAAKTYTMNYLLNKTEELQNQDNTIDIYLIAGQSNAAGSTHIDCVTYNHTSDEKTHTSDVTVLSDGTLQNLNEKYVSGFDNILYSGRAANNYATLTTAKANVHSNGMMGPEVGMAESLSTYYDGENGRIAGLIKYAWGGTSLLDKENTVTDTRQDERGNWVSPSYEEYLIEQNGDVLHGEMTGKLYDNFIAQVEQSLKEYEMAGYNPVIKGLYWMQGEDDRTLEAEYKVAFKYFVDDVRKDLAKLTGDEGLKSMPIIIGEISETFSAATDTMVAINQTFIQMQHELAIEIDNCYIAYNGKYHINVVNEAGESEYAEGVVDGAHWNWSDCLSIGNDVGNIIKKNILGVTE